MIINKYIQSVVLAFSATFLTGCAVTAAPAKPKVVLQVSDGDAAKWNLALNNAKNVQQEYGGADKVSIEIVAYGPGIGMLKSDATTNNRITEATKSGIQVVACENTMTTQKLTKADMNASISYARSGVVQLMKRQDEGWAYVRP
ncbi:DsrE family protein [Polaromonas sp. AER18D-145]|uniref:DsrE family protein n=1 Tax=Polaromonas sp. AER18D-145 TaxID=1977060 RepID=UPI000BBBCF91|nr:DsrE family protein [Polaromonas sp. AER18D-145]